MVDIFSDNKERVDEILADDGMLRDAQYVLNYFLPFFEAVGDNEIVRRMKDVVVELVTPKAFLRVEDILESLKEIYGKTTQSTFDGIYELLQKFQVSPVLSSTQVTWKSTGSTVMKMLKEARDNEDYRKALTAATIQQDSSKVGQVLNEVILSLRDLSRAKIVINHQDSSTLGKRYIKAVNEVIDIVKTSQFLTFRSVDVEKGEAVETSLDERRKKHAKKIEEKGFKVITRESGAEGTNIAIGMEGVTLELQVLTSLMNEKNEKNGRMAHAFYKAGIPGEVVELIRSKYEHYLRREEN